MAKRCCRIYDFLIIDATAPFSGNRELCLSYEALCAIIPITLLRSVINTRQRENGARCMPALITKEKLRC